MRDSEWARQGTWLFLRRSYLPVALLIFVVSLLFLFELRLIYHLMTKPLYEFLFQSAGLLVIGTGVLVRILTSGYTRAGTSEGTTSSLSTAALNTRGMYSLMRHPLYFGNGMLWLGISFFTCNPVIVFLVTLIFWMYYERIMMAEEAYLSGEFEETFEEWKSNTPLFFPNPLRWEPPRMSFQWRRAL